MDTTPKLDFTKAIPGSLSSSGVSVLYRFGLGLVTVAMILLPLVYIALILAVALGVLSHAVLNFDMFLDVETGRSNSIKARVYLLPIGVGLLVIFFLLKPFLARPASPKKGRTLPRGIESDVYELVTAISSAVGAPAPREIRVNCDPNASAGFTHGFRGMLRRDLTLTIGLPLTSGLTLRQFAGVLAHEFGHFSQNAGMRLTFIIRSINHWFARVVHERDKWDELLSRWSEAKLWSWAFGLQIVAWWSRLFVWISRSILRVLMFLGNLISCFMLRQMEFDADRYGIRLVGSETFTATAVRLHLINAATQQAYVDLQEGWEERRLAEDLPGLIALRISQIRESATTSVMERIEQSTTAKFDTHPCDRDRIRMAVLDNAEGVLGPEWDRPATSVFRDFEGVSRKLTTDKYREMLGKAASEVELVPAIDLIAKQAAFNRGVSRLGEFFLGAIHQDRPLYWPSLEGALRPVSDPATLNNELSTLRATMQSGAEKARANFERWSNADLQLIGALKAEGFLHAGKKPNAVDFGLESSTIQDAVRATTEASRQKKSIDTELGEFRWAAERRIEIGLSAIAQKGKNRDMAEKILKAMAAMRTVQDSLNELRCRWNVLTAIKAVLDEDTNDKKVLDTIKHVTTEVSTALDQIFNGLAETAYPFGHGQKDASLADYVLGGLVPPSVDIQRTERTAAATLQRSTELYLRILGQLVTGAIAGERLLDPSLSESTGQE